jgi:prepilin-type N-terminal cleavage/methylation domain-containing protein
MKTMDLRITFYVLHHFVRRCKQHLAVEQQSTWGRSGLTLVEVLVAMGLAGIFCTVLYGFYQLHISVLKAEEVRINVRESSRLTVDFMVRELHLAGARPLRGGPCDGFERLTVAEEQRVTMQYDFRGDTASAPPDGCPDDPSELITYTYDGTEQVLKRATGGGAPQPFINDVPADGFLLQYFDRDGNELIPALTGPERAAVHSIVVTIRTSKAHPDPSVTDPIDSELSSTVFLPNPPG